MDKYTLIAPCHFGLETVLKREITDMGYDIVKVEDGRVIYEGDENSQYICEYCGSKYSSIQSLTSGSCTKRP